MRRSSNEHPASTSPRASRPNDFDFGFGCHQTNDSLSPSSRNRHYTVSAGCAVSRNGRPTDSITFKTNGGTIPPLPPTATVSDASPGFASCRRQPSSGMFTIRKQDSIPEEPASPFSIMPPGSNFDWPSRSPSPLHHRGSVSTGFDSPEWRKRSLSPAPTGAHSNSMYTNVFARRKQFVREVSAAHSDVTETICRKMTVDVATSPIPPALSCENNLQIRFDISSNSSLAKSTSSSTFHRSASTHRKKTYGSGGGSLLANGFVPLLNVESKPSVGSVISTKDPSKWNLSVKKQRSCSESAFQIGGLHPPVLDAHCRRSSVAILNPHKEQAILRKILGPSGLSWLSEDAKKNAKRDQQSKKSVCSAASEDLENGRADDSRTPLMKEGEKGGRLIYRQHLFHVRRITSDYALFCAILGIIVMILENELSAGHVYNKNTITSLILKAIILTSTFALIALVIKFHVHEVQLFMNANSAEDWRIALTFQRCFQIFLELSVCAICPLPFDLSFNWTTVHADGETVTTTNVPLDVFLSIPMFFRLYWLCRVMLLHSRLFTDASSRSIAGLNRVTFNARFILKTLMTLCPGTMLMVFTASLWVLAAWILRLCERHHVGDPPNAHAIKHQNYLNSLWMIAITFLSVGYGDLVPNTYCGRGVAVITGILGTCTSSMVVAVIARKLELSRAEKHVHNFMIDTQLTKQLKHSAANVLRETWLIYKHRRLVDKIDPGKIRHHQRKFLMAIYALRKVKRDQRKLAENSVSLGDVAKTTSNSYELIHDIHSIQEGLALRMTAVEHQLSDIQREIGGLAEVLRAAMGADQRRLSTDVDNNMPRDSLRRRRAAID
uniref:CaMBD domain-containing protein n=1 Tax=Panagrellus redivivus TaxID=6233 RepID=A0A7E4VBW9_PANRE